jgi:ribosomal protein S17E
MGKIKSKTVKKTVRELKSRDVEFRGNFDYNKNLLKGVSSSKKVRNQIAGYAVRVKKQDDLKKQKLAE